MGRMMGLEPTNAGATIRCVNPFATFAMAGVVGIEPTSTVLETGVLPLYYTPRCYNIISKSAKYCKCLIKCFLVVSVKKGLLLYNL